MAEKLEQLLSNLLQPSNEVIQQATEELKVAVKDPNIVPALCSLISSSPTPQVRQYAAVLLRRRILRKSQYSCLPPDVTANIRQNILQVLLNEPEKSVQKGVAQVIGTVAKHDLPENKWPELFQFLVEFLTVDNAQQREIGMYVLQTLAQAAGQALEPHYSNILELCNKGLNDPQSTVVPFYSIQTITHLVPMLGSQHVQPVQQMIPRILEIIKALIGVDEDQAIEAMDIFDELFEVEVSIVVPHIKTIIEFCLLIGANKDLGDNVRVKALSFISWIVKLKRKMIIKLKLIQPLLQVLFPIVCEPYPEDEEDFDEAESSTPATLAAQVVDTMALNLPPEKFIPPLMRLVEPGLKNQDPNVRRGGYTAMAVTAEGCADHIRNKVLKSWVETVYQGLSDPVAMVRSSSFFALGQFSEHLQPDISKFSDHILPTLFSSIEKSTADIEKDPRGVTKTYYALEVFIENLGKDLNPWLEPLMNFLMTSISSSPSPKAKELAISSLAATANAVEDDLIPYFPQILNLLQAYLNPTEDELQLKVQLQAIDTLAVLARTVGRDTFLPITKDCMRMGLSLSAEATDPDLRRCVYGLFASISILLKEDMNEYLPRITKQMLDAITSTEGVTAHVANPENQVFKIFDDVDINLENGDGEVDGEDEHDIQGLSVENAYLEEKEDACMSLGEIAVNTGLPFMEYMEASYVAVSDLLEYPAEDIRKAAILGVGKLCIAVGKVASSTGDGGAQTALLTMLNTTVPRLLKICREEKEIQVTISALEAIKDMVDEIKEPVVQIQGVMDGILVVVKEVLQNKCACQDALDLEEQEEEGDEDENAEYDHILTETAGDIIPSIAKVIGGEAFAPYFAGFLPEIMKKLKKNSSTAEKSLATGIIGETMEACGPASSHFCSHLYPALMALLKDDEEEVRSNACYSLGVLTANAGQKMHPNYPHVLKGMFDLFRHESDQRVKDNICGATCRMIMSNIDGIPMPQVFPVVLQCLPLKKDLEENETAFTCISTLYKTGNENITKNLATIIKVSLEACGTKSVQKLTSDMLVELLKDITSKQPDAVRTVVQAASPEIQNKVQQMGLAL